MKIKKLQENHTKPLITAEFVRSVLSYNPESGELHWTTDGSGERPHKRGDRADKPGSHGYRRVRLQGWQLSAHRLAWLMTHGKMPDGQIDHRDGNRGNNAICNLRDATPQLNSENKRAAYSNSKTGLLGVTEDHSGRFMARIFVAGQRRYLGMHDTAEQAHQAYLAAKREMHAGCTV